jgi:pantetheine-phosphate adenylyltransferase
MRAAMYPGTFDPITNGHLDIIQRASGMFDMLYVAVAQRSQKDMWFSLASRKRFVAESTKDITNVKVITLSGLLADQCKKLSVNVVIRGLRAVSDFEYEMMMALMNRKLYPRFETVFLMPSARYVYLHSSLVREVSSLGGDVSDLVPDPVARALRRRKRRKK